LIERPLETSSITYPPQARDSETVVWYGFLVILNENGQKPLTFRYTKDGGGCDEEALRAAKEIPKSMDSWSTKR